MMKDTVATVLYFLFTEDKKEHPMPPGAVKVLFEKIKLWLHGKEVE